jgi:hypothetical protein
MSCFALNSQGDLDISTGNFIVRTDIPTVAAHKLTCLFRFFQGEFFADSRLGIPYFTYVFVKNPDLGVIRRIFQRVIEFVPEVTNVSGDIQFITTTRQLIASFIVRVSTGAILTGGPGQAFIVKASP